MVTLPASRRLRLGRVSHPGGIYLVTTTTWNRARLFRDHDCARAVARLCHAERTWPGATCLAWVLMPDHWHGLIELHHGELASAVRRFKSFATKELNRRKRRHSPVWQKGFHDAGLRSDEDVRAAARYVVANPVRAGLVDRVNDYPYWNAVWL